MRPLVPLCITAAMLVLPAQAGARIVPGKGMAGVRIGMKQSRVIAVLGQPAMRKTVMDDFGKRITFKYTSHGGLTLTLRPGLEQNELFAITTAHGVERTEEGVGVGTAERTLKRKLSGETCKTEFGRRNCTIGAFEAGEIVTDFRMRNGRVGSVLIGRVVD